MFMACAWFNCACLASDRSVAVPHDLRSQLRLLLSTTRLSKQTGQKWLKSTFGQRRMPMLSHEEPQIVDAYQELLMLLERKTGPEVHAEMSVLVDVMYSPELLFPEDTVGYQRAAAGGFMHKCTSLLFCCRLHELAHFFWLD